MKEQDDLDLKRIKYQTILFTNSPREILGIEAEKEVFSFQQRIENTQNTK